MVKYLKFYKKFNFIDQNGSITMVLVLSSMVGIFGLAVMQASKNQSDSQRNIYVRDAADNVTDDIRSLLQDHGTCKSNFKSAGF